MSTATTAKSVLCKLYHTKIRALPNFQAINEIFAKLKYPFIFGANESENCRFSYWMAEPKQTFTFIANGKKPFEKLNKTLKKYKLDKEQKELPTGMFCGGWAGFFSYELGRFIEKLPQKANDDIEMPLIRLGFYDKILCFDNKEKMFWLTAVQLSDEKENYQQKLHALEKLLCESENEKIEKPICIDIDDIDFSQAVCNINKDYYFEAIKKIKRHLRDGDVYQVNFSQRFQCDYENEPIKLFNWQNYYNPSPYAAYIDAGEFQIVSASPEMFVTVNDNIIQTKPIKGTRRKVHGNTQLNQKNYNELLNNEKEKAELNMIIDLERNDLGRICQYGSIKVVQPRTIEEFATVLHAVAVVEGKLRKKTFCDIIKAMFPGGSITGAPKIAAMEIIDSLEPTARNVYTGSIGFIGIDENLCLNIAIRTIIIKNNKAYTQVGGGIVADSKAEDEWEETITKARALIAGINSINQK